MAILGTVVYRNPTIVIRIVVLAPTLSRIGVGFNLHGLELPFIDWAEVALKTYQALQAEDLSYLNGGMPVVVQQTGYRYAEKGINFAYQTC